MSQRQETDTGSHTYCLYSKAALDKNTTELAGRSGRVGQVSWSGRFFQNILPGTCQILSLAENLR